MRGPNFSITLEGLDEMKELFKQAKDEVKREVSQAVARSTLSVHSRAVKRIQNGPASGIVYELYKPRRTHQASAPGQPPMSDTGRLASSMQFEIDELTGYVFTPVEYGPYLEFGTSRMAARPFLFPSVEEERPVFMKALKEILS